jgi:hypothetical protein
MKFAILKGIMPGIAGAGDGARTRHIQLGRLTLYQLSYSRIKRIVILSQLIADGKRATRGCIMVTE